MRMNGMFAGAFVATAIGSSAAFAADIVDTASGAGNFTTLTAAVEAAGLVDTLKGDGPFTVFAPTDEAFAKLPAGTVESLRALLSHRGLVFVEVPNTAHEYWTVTMYHAPHLHFFTAGSLKSIFARFSLACVDIREFGRTYRELNRARASFTNEDYGPKEKGFWIRALFQKS